MLKDCEIGAGAEVLANSIIEGAKVGAGARVGPFARLRPEADIGRGLPHRQLRRDQEIALVAAAARSII
jgi:carbonic anhydrase/acetyltransferase-like protein (isoleucine patch superfamily)